MSVSHLYHAEIKILQQAFRDECAKQSKTTGKIFKQDIYNFITWMDSIHLIKRDGVRRIIEFMQSPVSKEEIK